MTLLMVVGTVIMASGTGQALGTTALAASRSWGYPNGDLANTRVATGSTISTKNVGALKQAWTFTLKGTVHQTAGSLASNPIVQNGVVYVQDFDSNVYALNLASGKLIWEHAFASSGDGAPGPNGIAVTKGVLYGATARSAFALDASTGKRIWTNNDLLEKGQGNFGIQPQVATGRVYLASQAGLGPGGGVLLALNASTGAVLWRFNTVLGTNPGVEALGLGSGGAWETPLVGTDGSVTYGIGNPYQSAASAITHPSAQPYTDSDVTLTAATGKLRWYYQAVPNDFKDYDMQTSPISASVNGVPVIIGSGKMGYVCEMNAVTGTLLWKTAVGEHNGHDNDSLYALEGKSTLRVPYTFLPGTLGGVLTNLALAGGTIYVVTNDSAFKESSLAGEPTPVGSATGEVEALSLATGKVEWDTKVTTLPLGAATVSNDLVFTTLYRGILVALNAYTGAIVYEHRLPTSTNAPIAIAGNMIVVPAGAPGSRLGHPQVVAYSVPQRASTAKLRASHMARTKKAPG